LAAVTDPLVRLNGAKFVAGWSRRSAEVGSCASKVPTWPTS